MHALQTALSQSLVERDDEIHAILLGLVARENTLLVGPPGVAKSLLCRSVASAIDGLRYCERLLAPTTPPEALFGPISISALREDRYEHVGAGTVSECHLAFFDEFFRGSDAILDNLLHLMGPERQALIGTQQVSVPLISAVGATNSWPDTGHQSAILDRWLIRREVKPVSPQGRERLMFEHLPGVTPVVTVRDVELGHAEAMALPVSVGAREALLTIIERLHGEGIRPSDRRCRKSLSVAKAAAWLDGARPGSGEVEDRHLEPLGMVLWDDPREQPEKCAAIVSQIANPVGAMLNELLKECDEVVREAGNEAGEQLAGVKKLQEVEAQAKRLSVSGNGRAAKCLAYVQRERVKLQAKAMGLDASKVEGLLAGVK